MAPSVLMRICFVVVTMVLLCYPNAYAQEIKGPLLSFNDENIYVSFDLNLSPDKLESVSRGASKEIIFYIDLFRSWGMWPDEFIRGRRITRTLLSDSMKKEYVVNSHDGTAQTVKRFNNFQSMMKWALSFDDIPVGGVRNLEAGKYFIRVTAESRHKEIPSIISEIFFFLPSRDFRVSKDSQVFIWDNKTITNISR